MFLNSSSSASTTNDNVININNKGDAAAVCHIDFSGMDDLLDETDKDTERRLAMVAFSRNEDDDDEDEDSVDLIDDDNSVDYLAAAVSDFFRSIFFCGCPTTTTTTTTSALEGSFAEI